MKEQLTASIDHTGVLLKEQCGFRKHHACESALNQLLSKWKQCIDLVFRVKERMAPAYLTEAMAELEK